MLNTIKKLTSPKSSSGSSDKHTDPAKRFKFGECLGKGAFASVYKAIDRSTRQVCAVKKMSLDNPLMSGQQPITEFLIGKSLVHANIVSTLDCLETPEHLFIQLELVDGGDLFSQLDPSGPGLDLGKSQRLTMELAVGIKYLHTMNIVHCDLKPENVLVHKGHIKICDFGLAGYSATERHGTATGTGAYMAPELINRRSSTPYHLQEAQDVWSFGIILYAILFSDLPWEKARLKDEDFKLFCKKGGVSSSLYPFNTVASPMRALLRGVLAIKASQRPSMVDIIEHMETGHEWFQGGKKQAITSYGMRDLTPEREQKAAKQARAQTKAAPVTVQVQVPSKHHMNNREPSSASSGSSPSIHDAIEPLSAAIVAKYAEMTGNKNTNAAAAHSKYDHLSASMADLRVLA